MCSPVWRPAINLPSRRGARKPGAAGRLEALSGPRARIEAMDAVLLDVDEPESSVGGRPERPLAQRRAERPDAFGLAGAAHPQPASIQYSWPVHMRPSSEARNSTSDATCSGWTRSFRHWLSTISASAFGRVPAHLPRRADVARHDSGDADVIGNRARAPAPWSCPRCRLSSSRREPDPAGPDARRSSRN